MFDHFAWSVLATPLLVVLGAHLMIDRLRPEAALRVFAWSAAVAAAASTVTLLLFAVKALVEVPAIAALGGLSAEAVVADTAHVPWVSWVSLAWVVLAAPMVAWRWHGRRAAVRAARGAVEGLESRGDLVTVADDRVAAFALPGLPRRIVVTTGMLEVLDERQRGALIAHERAHLAGDHHRLVWITRLAATAHPALWPVARQVAYLVERVADESAAAELGDRRHVARAIGVAALAAKADRGPLGTLMALGPAPGTVPRRVSALMAPRPRLNWPAVLLVLLAVGTVVWTGECARDFQELLELASTHAR
ncbi:M56 family metallopeptidase [Umezawaea sp. Da 62-37]|uniref:M56 family metallopeptidase n=1 Tax=Umezawaea sp. Da 62-37 TaxID=3075927 RepID=UPI0028F739AE|nr:M56 family metallopeptidase [Umezawaea sp. Da 62-37]WNV86963.1 M56 family metallopeptidase [Umezawaea sp. Da 62-37]